ncbi:MAG TPA: hypothetical protein VFV41_18295, partial [Streptosporangiaceae bacterium]|nr:hypothetical protein [Streptosporangiaceae bacterium]
MREYVLTLLVTAAVTYILTPLVRRGAIKAGAEQAVRDRDVHVVPIPRLGGLAMYAGLAVGLLVAGQMSPLDSVLSGSNMAIGLLLGGGLVVAMGVIDDRWGMNAISKLAGQVAAGVILVASGTELGWLPLPGGGTFSPTSNQALVLTVLVVVATINAVNFIDGLDGLAAGIVAIAAISFFLYYYSLTHTLRLSAEAAPTLASALLAGMCLGFLPHNFFPARIFMGDTGSMLLGLLLAYVPISSITSLDPRTLTGAVNRFPEVLPLLLPTTILVIPYADMLMAVVRRTRAGLSPFAADRKHLHHRLLDIGHSHRLSVLIMYLWAAMFSGLIVWFSTFRTPLFAFAVITLAAVLALLLMSMPRLRWWQRDRRKDLAPAVAGQGSAAAQVPVSPAATAGAPVLTPEPVSQLGADDWFTAGPVSGDRYPGDASPAGRHPGGLTPADLRSDDPGPGGLRSADGRSGDARSGDVWPGDAWPTDVQRGDARSADARSGDAGSGSVRSGDARSGAAYSGESRPGARPGGERIPAERFPGEPFPAKRVPGESLRGQGRSGQRAAADGPAGESARSIWEPARPASPARDRSAGSGAGTGPGGAAGLGRSRWEPARRAGDPGTRGPARDRSADHRAPWPDDPALPAPGSGGARTAGWNAPAPDDLTADIPPIPPKPSAGSGRSVVGAIPPAVPLGAPPPDPLHPDISGPDALSDD